MVLSKKKLRSQTKHIEQEETPEVEQKPKTDVKLTDEQLFATNVAAGNLKARREKLKDNRFKEIQNARTSKTEQVLIRRLNATMQRKEAAGVDPRAKKRAKVTEEDLYGGELEDIWSTPLVQSRSMATYKTKFAAVEHVKVKAVILPRGGQSYNPALKEHGQLLKDAAKQEEAIVAKNLKDLKKVRPLQFREQDPEQESVAGSDHEAGSNDNSDDSDDSSSDVDVDKPLGINKPVDRMNIKTQAQRNRDVETRAKAQKIKDLKAKRKFDKDLERIDNLLKQNENTSKQLARKIDRQAKAELAERTQQETVGTITKPKSIGRFKYKQRKLDYQLEDQLSGSLRQMRPLGNDTLLEDRFDSIFRRNLVEPDAPAQNEKRRQKKQKYKMISKLGPKAVEMHHETAALKKRNDAKQKGFKRIANDDLIMI